MPNPTDKKRSPNDAQTTRSPGRPRSNRIDQFGTDSFLRQNPKFIKFKRKLGISEEKAWTIITSMFCYISQNEALTTQIKDPDILAEFCYWDGDSLKLTKALEESGFTKNGKIVNWFQNQPHAARKLHNYDYYQKQKEQELGDIQTISDNLSNGNDLKLVSEQSRLEQSKEVSLSSASADNTPSAIDLAINDFATKYNKLAEKFPALRKVRIPLTPGLRKKLLTRLKEPEFDTDKVLLALYNSKWHHGDNDKNWAASFNWIVKNSENYTLILAAATTAQAQSHPTANQKPPDKCPKCGHELRDDEWCTNPQCGYVTDAYAKKHPDNQKNSTENFKNQ